MAGMAWKYHAIPPFRGFHHEEIGSSSTKHDGHFVQNGLTIKNMRDEHGSNILRGNNNFQPM
jgi:hypothetical protein